MEELITKAKKGDVDAFNEIIPIIKRRLYIIAKSRLYNEEDVLDIMQITFTKAFKCIKQLKDESKFSAWITNILINNCNTFLKRNLKLEKVPYETDYLENICADNEYVEIDDKLSFFKVIDFLSEEEKLLLSMYYSEEYTTKEIGEILKTNEGTVRSKISRAKSKIIDRYREGELN